ncbi:MAG: AAA family ATPase, partial [Solirubrobacterales bacterium]|nr:AAA family ATPase [Solirubrobacterales bacterium]
MLEQLAGDWRVALVCAPAGSGKTVLLESWAQAAEPSDRVAWVSIRRGEREAARFWRSVTEALSDAIGPGLADLDLALDSHAVVDQLVDEFDSLGTPGVLVIDDLHELGAADALAGLERLLARLPHELRVILGTREAPRLGLHRLRLAGQLAELRAPDLRFSLEETAELLRAAGITLSDAGVERLHSRTEGWAAGLRLATNSLARHPNPERFVTEFSGSERTVAGYLLEEVLARHTEEVRDLLLRTSVLDRVSGPLADYLTGGLGAERTLQELADASAFVSSLNVSRSWFSYHPLFADLPKLELRRLAPATVPQLHQAAARWHEREGNVVDAIRCAEAAGDWPTAGRLLSEHHLDLTLEGRSATVRELLRALPDDLAAADPELALAFAAARLLDGELAAGAAYLELAQGSAEVLAAARRPSFDRRLALLKLILAGRRGELEDALMTLQTVEKLLSGDPAIGVRGDELRSLALAEVGVAELSSSRLEQARAHLEEALALARRANRPWLAINALGHLAVAGPWTGTSLCDALRLSEEAVRIAEEHGLTEDPVIVTALAAGALALLWLGQFDEAERWVGRAEQALPRDGESVSELILGHARALLRLVHDQPDEAAPLSAGAALLHGAHPLAVAGHARRLQAQAASGGSAAARAGLAGVGAEQRNTPEMRLAAAAIHLAEAEPEQAVAVLDGLEGMPCSVIEGHLLTAVAHDALGDREAAERSLETALGVAEPDGIVLPFVLVPVQGLLERIPGHRTT